MIIRNLIAVCDNGHRRPRDLASIDRLIIHRIDFSQDEDGAYPDIVPIFVDDLDGYKVAQRFMDGRPFRPGAYTGREVPYSLLCRTDGSWDQLLTLDDISPHAKRWNATGLALSFAGDFRRHEPTAAQWQSGIEMARCLMTWLGKTDEIFGHTELPGATNDAEKKCPGGYFPMAKFRGDVAMALPLDRQNPIRGPITREFARRYLEDMGLVFE